MEETWGSGQVLKRKIGDHFLQRSGFRPQFFHFGRCRLSHRVTRQAVLSSFEEFL